MLDAGQCDAMLLLKALFRFMTERVGGAFAGNRHDIDFDSSSNSSRADISALSASASAAVGLFDDISDFSSSVISVFIKCDNHRPSSH